ncbi:hypothetical protein Q3G72_030566 [Acer saccharum]|nr:hypothetical protein Q3G72_030566 [Acer saccharum]
MLATFLLIVGHNNRYCLVCDTFGRSHFTTSINFNKVLKALNTIASDMLAKPGSLPSTSKLKESTRIASEVLIAHIPAMITGHDVSSYCNRHGTISQNVLVACNFDLEFMYILSGWEGSSHDSKLLTNALTRRRTTLKVLQGKYYLVDCGFPNRRQFLAPFRGVRYHLQEFGGQGRDPANEVELFNLRHASLRNVIERIFDQILLFNHNPPVLGVKIW